MTTSCYGKYLAVEVPLDIIYLYGRVDVYLHSNGSWGDSVTAPGCAYNIYTQIEIDVSLSDDCSTITYASAYVDGE